MKITKYISVFTLSLITFLPKFSDAQWQQVTGLYGENIKSIRATSSRLFALSQIGVLRSDNNGATWTDISPLFLANIVERLAVSGDTVLVYAQPDSYISTNNGTTWATLNAPAGVSFISDVGSGGGQIYMCTFGEYFYKSANSGANWTQVTAGLTTPITACMATEGTTVYVGTDNGIFKSTNSGTSFAPSGLAGEFVLKIHSSSPYVFAYTGAFIYKSDDDGATWQLFQPAVGFTDITDFAVNGTNVFATTTGDLIYSDLSVNTWQQDTIANGVLITLGICNKGTDLYLGCNRGVFNSDNSGASWTEMNTGIIPIAITALTVTPGDTLYAGASTYGTSFYDGTNWTYSGLATLNINSHVSDASGVYAANDVGINRSVDGGTTWELISNSLANPIVAYCPDVAVQDSVIIGAALQLGMLRSGDYGATWALVDAGLLGEQMSCVTFSGNNIIAGTYTNGLFTSTDAGLTWVQTGGAGQPFNDVASIGNFVFAAALTPNGNLISSDGGLTWNPSSTSYFDRLSVYDSIMVGSSDSYIQLSRDSGQTFLFSTPGPAGSLILSNQVTADDIYIGTGFEGVWKITISEVTGIGPEHASNSSSAWIYPNVFSHETTLFVNESSVPANLELFVYDIKGKLVKQIAITDKYTRIESGYLDAGMYLYRIISDLKVLGSGKMVIQSH